MGDTLRYNISDWHQLKDVRSNTSNLLSIKVADIIDSPILSGLRIRIVHATLGELWTCVLNAVGEIINQDPTVINVEPSTDEILTYLAKYGFDVAYNEVELLPQAQLAFLRSLKDLGYDKLRILPVWTAKNGVREGKSYVVVFKIAENPDWINNAYSPSFTEFTRALQEGSVVNVSASSRANAWNWSWLTYVADIDDILNANS